VVNGYTDERRTPKAKSDKTLSQVVQLVNHDCRLNRDSERISRCLPESSEDPDFRGSRGCEPTENRWLNDGDGNG